jgi:hypothetical protein
MPCPKNPTEFTLLKSVLNQHDVSPEYKEIITKGITQIFKDEKKKKKWMAVRILQNQKQDVLHVVLQVLL